MCSSGGSGAMKRIRSACLRTSSSKTCFVSLSRDLVEAIGLRVQVCLLTLLAVFLVYTVCGPWSATKNLLSYNTRRKFCLEFSPHFIHSLFIPLFSLKCAPLLPQCWATRFLEHWDDCNPKSTLGRGKFKICDEYCSWLSWIGWFSNRTRTSVDDCARKSNNWLDQWQRGKLGTGNRV